MVSYSSNGRREIVEPARDIVATPPVLGNWRWRDAAPETAPGYDDSRWVMSTQPEAFVIYGFQNGYDWYRAKFKASATNRQRRWRMVESHDEAVYGSRPFEVFGEGEVRYTRNRGNVYATMLNWNGGPVTLKSLRSGGATLGKVSKVELLGSEVPLTFIQDEQGLTVTDGGAVQPLPGITNQSLASGCRVLRITHDKSWINDDDLDVTAPGWIRRCNLETGDYNNDLVISETPGDVWSCSFTGRSVTVIAPKEARAGKIKMQIDGKTRAMADLSITGTRLAQQRVCSVTGLNHCKHSLAIVNRGPGPVAVDAIVVR